MLLNTRTPSLLACISLLAITIIFSITAQGAPGALDTTFGNGGKVVSPIGKNSGDHSNASALQPDGKIVVAGDSLSDDVNNSNEGQSIAISRINPDGSLDDSFGSGGKVIKRFPALSRAYAVIIQPDGKIVVGGIVLAETNTEAGYRYYFLLIRLNPNGSFDNSFGANGIVQTSFANSINSYLYSLALQSNGKIVAAGLVASSIGVARYNTDGSLDTTFDGDGKVLVNVSTAGNRANSVSIQPDNKIVIGGYATVSGIQSFALIRLNTDGSFDNGFDGDGKLTTVIGTTSSLIKAVKIQSDGKIVAVGVSNNSSQHRDTAVARYNADGSLDTSFDTDGIVITDIDDDNPTGAEIQSDGKILVGGYIGMANSATYYDFLSIRYNSDGSLDTSYNGNGKVVTTFPLSNDIATSILVQPNGKIVLSGYSDRGTDSDIILVRNNADGSLDTSFDSDGIVTIELGNSADIINKIAIQPDGKIVAAGYSFGGTFQQPTIARYNSNGSLDTSFGNQGSVIAPSQPGGQIYDVAIQTDGKIVASVSVYGENIAYTVLRYNSNGSLDESFGVAGTVTVKVGTMRDIARGLAIQMDGKIIVSGFSYDSGGYGGASLIRLNSDGSLDANFGVGGKVITTDQNHSGTVSSMALQPDGKIIIAGEGYIQIPGNSNVFFLNRYNSDGSLDSSFGDGGTVYTIFASQGYANANAVAVQSDGKIVAAGYSDGSYAFARYNADGTLDDSFDGDGKVVITQANSYNSIYGLVIQPNGYIVAATSSQNAGGGYDAAVLRLKADGSLDNNFGNGGKAITPIGDGDSVFLSVLLQPDGKIVGGGYSRNGANNDFTLVRYDVRKSANVRRTLSNLATAKPTEQFINRQ